MLPLNFSGQNTDANNAVLALADGTVFTGISVGANGHCVAEIVFNTLMSGHQEVITDPSYNNQIVAFTYPHVGNTGVNDVDNESNQSQVSGIVMRDCSLTVSNFRAKQSLPEYLQQNNIVAIAGIDTRKLTRILRQNGRQFACIMVGSDADTAVDLARQSQQNNEQIKISQIANWNQPSADLVAGFSSVDTAGLKPHVVVYDLGAKQSISRVLVDKGCRVTLASEASSAKQILELEPDAVVISSGAGNPNNKTHAIDVCKDLLNTKLPILSIGLGCQIIALANNAQVNQLKTGNHGCNHPVKQLDTNQVFISTQKQDYAIDKDSLPKYIRLTHISLFDGSIQGFQLENRPVFGLQAYPEANSGPRDLNHVFDQFISLSSTKL